MIFQIGRKTCQVINNLAVEADTREVEKKSSKERINDTKEENSEES